MELFKERIKEALMFIVAVVITIAIIGVPISLIELTRFIWKPLPDIIWGVFLLSCIVAWIKGRLPR